MAKRDYYEVLGVPKDASTEDIISAYKKKAMLYHPDRQQGKSDAEKKKAEELFKECSEAAETLRDPDKRKAYDQFGPDGVSGGGSFGGGGFSAFDAMDIFRRMRSRFGGFDGFDDESDGPQAFDENAPERGRDIQMTVSVSFKEMVWGCSKDLDLDLDKECPECKGTGIEPGTKPETCKTCRGRGQVAHVRRMGFMVQQEITDCPDCGGTGVSAKPCRKCGGRKRVAEKRHVKMKIPAGVRNGERLRLRGLGQCGLKGGPNGDLYAHIAVGGSDLFARNGDDVLVRAFVSPATASLGGKIEVPTLGGYRKVKLAPGTASGTRLKISGAGVKPESGRAGDMYVDVYVEPYASPTPEQRRLLEQLAKTETASSFAAARELRRKADEFYA